MERKEENVEEQPNAPEQELAKMSLKEIDQSKHNLPIDPD